MEDEILEEIILKKKMFWLKKHIVLIILTVAALASIILNFIYMFFTEEIPNVFIPILIFSSLVLFSYFSTTYIEDKLLTIEFGLKQINEIKLRMKEENISLHIVSVDEENNFVRVLYEYNREKHERKLKYSDVRYSIDAKESTIIIDDDLQVTYVVKETGQKQRL